MTVDPSRTSRAATPADGDARPIGVFDSGVGGLTVARALMDLLPDEQVVYLGDSARGPYGPRPLEEVRRFASENVDYLAGRGCKLVVAACNTATAAALGTDPLPAPVPTVGVIEPAVEVAARASRTGRIGVIGTVGTIASRAYERAFARVAPEVAVTGVACPRFVELVEAGRTADALARAVAADYLAPLVAAEVDTLVLGCTHYPLLTGVIGYVMGPQVLLVSSAEETARAVFRRLVDAGALAPGPRRAHEFVATGDPAAFGALASRFLGPRVTAAEVETLAWAAL